MTGERAGTTYSAKLLPLLENYSALHHWSISQKALFWSAVWDFFKIKGSKGSPPWLVDADRMPGASWFPKAQLNFAENLLMSGDDDQAAIIETGENGRRRELNYRELRHQVARLAATFRTLGVSKGDRVAAFLPNCAEAVITMLATSSLGAIYSSCSPDFGLQGVIDRFGQISPKVLVATNGYVYAGKRIDTRDRVQKIIDALYEIPGEALDEALGVPPGIAGPHLIQVNYLNETDYQPAGRPGALDWQCIQNDAADADSDAYANADTVAENLRFEPCAFNDPLYILYSSGTTGVPKCIVHSIGGTLLQHVKELGLHTDIKAGEKIFFYSTCGWMMWNWLVSALALRATIILFDGSPFHPAPDTLFDMAEREQVNTFGAGAKFFAACEKAGLVPDKTHRLPALKTILSTGSPLSQESFAYIYRSIKSDVCLSSISGGTDIVSCFALGNPVLPVYQGELQCAGLGMDVAFYDDDGQPLAVGKGELVCQSPFPSMPIGFWDDPQQTKFHGAYFSRFTNIWAHGDFGEFIQHHKGHQGIIIHGRSDAVLNPGGVRIGTAELYRQVEKIPSVLESLAVGQKLGDDERVILFVKLRDGYLLNDELHKKICQVIRENTTPRHVPSVICQVADLPRTISGKIVELAVRQMIHGEEVKNRHALANPEALEFFRNLPELQIQQPRQS